MGDSGATEPGAVRQDAPPLLPRRVHGAALMGAGLEWREGCQVVSVMLYVAWYATACLCRLGQVLTSRRLPDARHTGMYVHTCVHYCCPLALSRKLPVCMLGSLHPESRW